VSARYFSAQAPPAEEGSTIHWRKSQSYQVFDTSGKTYLDLIAEQPDRENVTFHINLNLLAAAVGDDPLTAISSSGSLVDPVSYRFRGKRSVMVQPWVEKVPALRGHRHVPLPIGPRLANFLDDPLGIGRPLNLALPFFDYETTPSQAWLRSEGWHGSIDFSVEADLGQPRRLIDVCAAADGVVAMFLARDKGPNRGIILEHEPAPGAVFRTLYQHLDAASVGVVIGERVRAGQRLGKITFFPENGADHSHLHFTLAVRRRGFRLNGVDIPALWYCIDPFGVYDYHTPDQGPNYVYVPRPRGGLTSPIRGAERVIQWAGNPPIEAIRAEVRTPYSRIRRVQVRVRRATVSFDTSPTEQDQFLVWLEDLDPMFFLGLGGSFDRAIEHHLTDVLSDAYTMGHKVSLGYRFVDGQRHICAAWVQR
jgi:hypothetical protein